MSESNDLSTASGHDSNGSGPRAVIHRQILDAAESQPDASIEAIADDITGATPELVERVFDEFGDPAQEAIDQQTTAEATPQPTAPGSDDHQLEAIPDDHDSRKPDGGTDDQTDATAASKSADATDESGSTDGAEDSGPTDATDESGSTDGAEDSGPTVPDPETLTETQLETLRAVHDRPTATQAELASEFGITAASVGQRVNAIDGFDWSERRAFTEAMFGSPAGSSGSGGDATSNTAEAESETTASTAEAESETTASTAEAESETTASTAETESETTASTAETESETTASTAEAESETTASTAEAESETTASTAEAESETTASLGNAENGTAPTGAETDGGTAQSTGSPGAGVDGTAADSGADDGVTTCECADEIEAIAAQIDRLDQRLTEQSPAASEPLDPDLVHKVTHACMQSDQISEAEELRILRSLMGTDDN